mmetsp:Transcript_32871/g.90803  ORF Transcript_32871/g.90803 Transcript_32871/m.90803 type:complete len:203 (+) Transcript_32871:92-700(+)
MEFTPWSISPPPRHEALFFLAISFRKPLPLTFRRSSAALSAHVSPAEPPNFCFALCELSTNLSSVKVFLHFSSSMRWKGTPAFFSSCSPFFFFFLCGAASAAACSSAPVPSTAPTPAASVPSASSLAASTSRFLFFFGGSASGSSAGAGGGSGVSAAAAASTSCFFFFRFDVSWLAPLAVLPPSAPLALAAAPPLPRVSSHN